MGTILDDVVILAPYTCSLVVLKVKPPYQSYLPDIPCAPVLTVNEEGQNIVVFKASLPRSITGTAGRADYQIEQTDGNGKVLATFMGTFNVARGVPVDMPDDAEDLSDYSLAQLYTLLSNISLVSTQLATIENLIGYPTEELETTAKTVIGAINDLATIVAKHSTDIGTGTIIVPSSHLMSGESGLIGLANAAYRKLLAHVSMLANSDVGDDPHNTRMAIEENIAKHNSEEEAHPSIRANVETNSANVAIAAAEIDDLQAAVGTAELQTSSKNIRGAVNEVNAIAKRAKEHAATNETQLISINAQLQGVGRTYAVSTFQDFISFINAHSSIPVFEDRNGDGVNEQYFITVSDLKTGDNVLIAELEVPDFWFEKTDTETEKTYSYNDVDYPLNAYFNGSLVGVMHILETDYNVIIGHATSAGQSAKEAAKSAEDALRYRNDTEAIANSIYVKQVAPPIDQLQSAIVLPSATLAQIGG
jgi:hypothetical protein